MSLKRIEKIAPAYVRVRGGNFSGEHSLYQLCSYIYIIPHPTQFVKTFFKKIFRRQQTEPACGGLCGKK